MKKNQKWLMLALLMGNSFSCANASSVNNDLFETIEEVKSTFHEAQSNSNPKTFLSRCANSLRDIVCNNAARAYYATSTTGYGSYTIATAEFLNDTLALQGFTLNELKDEKKYSTTLNNVETKFKNNISIKYLSKISKNDQEVQIVPLLVGQEVSRIMEFGSGLSPSKLEISLEETEAFSNDPYPFRVLHGIYKIEEEAVNQILYKPSFLIKKLINKFPEKDLNIHSLVSIDDIVDGKSHSGHFVYANIAITGGLVKVCVSDSNLNMQGIECYFDYTVPGIVEKLFADIGNECEMDLLYEYQYTGNQGLNFRDCARFAIIYLLNEALYQKIPNDLTPVDIWGGFKTLEAGGYEQYHQGKKEFKLISKEHAGSPLKPSRFAQFCGPRRNIADYILRFFGVTHPDAVPQDLHDNHKPSRLAQGKVLLSKATSYFSKPINYVLRMLGVN